MPNQHMQSKNKKYSMQFFAFFIITITLASGTIYFIQHYTQDKQANSTMLQSMTVLEGRFKTTGTYTDLLSWFLIFNQIQEHYHNYQDRYLDISEINDEKIIAIDPSKVVNNVRQTFWDNSVYMDSFVPPDTLKSHLYTVYGKYYAEFLSRLDPEYYTTEFKIDKDKSNYEIAVFESKDITLDQDAQDYWVFSSKDSLFMFHDRGNKMSTDERINAYTDIMFENLDKK